MIFTIKISSSFIQCLRGQNRLNFFSICGGREFCILRILNGIDYTRGSSSCRERRCFAGGDRLGVSFFLEIILFLTLRQIFQSCDNKWIGRHGKAVALENGNASRVEAGLPFLLYWDYSVFFRFGKGFLYTAENE